MRAQIISLMKQVDKEFSPSLSEKIDIESYVNKIIDHAVLFQILERGVLVGFLALYCNDTSCKVAYVTMVAIDKACRGKGLATSLIHIAIKYAKRAGFEKLSLEVYKSNHSALQLYKKLGFCVALENDESYLLECRF